MKQKQPRVLVIEDEVVMAEVLSDNLEAEGYSVSVAKNGQEGLEKWGNEDPDLVLLDVMLPNMDGFSLCRTMKKDMLHPPVLFLSAKGRPEDRMEGLSSGGDDYLVKPFHLPELLLRVKKMLARSIVSANDVSSVSCIGGHSVDFRKWQVTLLSGKTVLLNQEEIQLLHCFVQQDGVMLTREDLLSSVWLDGIYPSTRQLERYVDRLIDIFERDPASPRFFHRLRGSRFRFNSKGSTS